jgi:hypothetical protein
LGTFFDDRRWQGRGLISFLFFLGFLNKFNFIFFSFLFSIFFCFYLSVFCLFFLFIPLFEVFVSINDEFIKSFLFFSSEGFQAGGGATSPGTLLQLVAKGPQDLYLTGGYPSDMPWARRTHQ